MPEIVPVAVSNDRPCGKFPEMLHVIGVLPFVSLKPEEYSSFNVALARLPESFGGMPFIVSGNVTVADPASFVAINSTVKSPNTVGLPEIFPLSLILRPSGSPVAVQVIGFVPCRTCRFSRS